MNLIDQKKGLLGLSNKMIYWEVQTSLRVQPMYEFWHRFFEVKIRRGRRLIELRVPPLIVQQSPGSNHLGR